MAYLKQALTIAASDSGGGAGIQADIKAMQASGVYALSVLVAITAQNTRTITKVYPLPNDIIEAQIDAVFDDFEIGAVKTGLLLSAEIVRVVSAKLRESKINHLVVDPVMTAKAGGGCELLKTDAIEKMKRDLFPLAHLVTPNLHEAARLTGMNITTLEDVKEAARHLHQLGCANVLVKGGHFLQQPAPDLLYDGEIFTLFQGEFIDTPHTHGTGCTYAAAIAAHLALGKDLIAAIRASKDYLTETIRHALTIGRGRGPVHHFPNG